MKKSKILRSAMVLLLGLIVYFFVTSPAGTYATPDYDTRWEITVPTKVSAGSTSAEDIVTIAGTWEAYRTVTVTADSQITMTCDIDGSTVSTNVNFPNGISKHGVAPAVSSPISVDAPNVVLGLWTGVVNYEITYNDFPVRAIEVATLPTNTTYAEGENFSLEGMQLKVSYENGAEEVLDAATLPDVTFAPDTLKCSDTEVTVTYQEKSTVVPVTVNAALGELIVGDGFDTEYIEGEKIDPNGLTLEVTYTENGEEKTKPITDYTIEPSLDTELDSTVEKVTITYTENGQTVSKEIPITVHPKLKEATGVSPYQNSYIEGDNFSTDGMTMTVTYMENGVEMTKDVTPTAVEPNRPLTTADTTVTVSYTENGQTVSYEVAVTVIPQLAELVIDTTSVDTHYYENQTFDPTGLTVQAKYINNGVEELVPLSLDNLTISPSTSDALTAANDKVTLTYVDADNQTVTAEIPITVEAKTLASIAIEGGFDSVYGEEDTFDPTGMVVTKTYTDGSTETVTIQSADELTIGGYDFTLPDGAANKFVDIPISYTEDGVTQSATASVEVRYYPQMLSTVMPNEYLYGMLNDSITTVEIRDDGYVPAWTADDGDYWAEAIATPVDGVGDADDIMIYTDYMEGKITIVGNGSGKILLPDSCYEMFASSKYLTEIIGLELLDPRNTIEMISMFKDLERMESLVIPDTWDTSNVVDMQAMFRNFGRRATAPELDVSALDVTGADMTSMFSNTGLSHLDLSNFVVNEDNFIGSMFEDSTKLQTIEASGSWSMAHDGAGDMFKNCLSLIGGNGTTYVDMYPTEHIDDTAMAHIDGVDGLPGYFTYKAPSN